MFSSWLKPKENNEENSKSKTVIHAVLGTPINAPLGEREEIAYFACGCFWGSEKGFWKLPGVVTTAVGYAGGSQENPTYNQVCSGRTGHTEIVKVTWEEQRIDFSDLLKLFWECHNPTQGNRQGNDRGSQYRSAIYTTTKEQTSLARSSLKSYQSKLTEHGIGVITTEIKENQTFYYAEEYHQQYLAKPGSRPYCSAMPTKVTLDDFTGAEFKLDKEIWSNYDWNINHCILRSDNKPIS
tara:strand:+ start:1091 stop:1807 length:717 start_codon:yes stop_codon:yes gene_type:complete